MQIYTIQTCAGYFMAKHLKKIKFKEGIGTFFSWGLISKYATSFNNDGYFTEVHCSAGAEGIKILNLSSKGEDNELMSEKVTVI